MIGIISFIVSPIGRKVALGVCAGLLLLLLYNWVTQRAYDNGYSEGSYKVLNAMEEKMKVALEEQREAIEEEKLLVEEEKVKAKEDREEAIRTRAKIRRDVRNEVSKIKIEAGTEVDTISSIPPSELVTYIRQQLSEERELDRRLDGGDARGTSSDVYTSFSSESTSGSSTVN